MIKHVIRIREEILRELVWIERSLPSFIIQKGTMADYFTKFSVSLSLPDKAAQAYAIDLAQQASHGRQANPLPDNFPEALATVIEDWNFETNADSHASEHGVWLYSDSGGVDALCAFLQHLLQKFNPRGRVSFEWSYDCSKPRVDAYGGGAAIITAQDIKSISTGQWLFEHAK